VWAATRKPKSSAPSGPLALPPGPSLSSTAPIDAGMPASTTPVVPSLDQAQQMLAQYALDPGMPPDLAAQVARVLSAEGDPDKLDSWAAKLDQLHFPKAAQALRAKASALRAVQGAGTALGQISNVLASTPGGASTAPVDTTAIRDRARDIIARAAQLATQQPAATDAAAAVSRTAAAAARAATTGIAGDMQTASQEAAHAASTVVSPIAQSKASVAVVAAQAAIASGSPAAMADAANKVLDVAAQVLKDARAAAGTAPPSPVPSSPFPMPGAPAPMPTAPFPMPGVPAPSAAPPPMPSAPGGPSIDDRARLAAQAAAADIRAKGCWHENRDLVKEFQRIVYPAAGEVDGFYGPAVALAMAKYLPKVPAPCYWPKAPADRARAKADWQRMVRQANVNVGRLWMGG